MPREISGAIGAWLTNYERDVGPEQLQTMAPEKLVRRLSFSASDMTCAGWTKVGEAQVTVLLAEADSIINSKVEALRAERDKILADSQKRATELERQIQTLLALPCEIKEGAEA